MNDMTRKEHIEWCKKRALEYIDAGDIASAYSSMCSDLGKHDSINMEDYRPILTLGMAELMNGSVAGMTKWIEGFN